MGRRKTPFVSGIVVMLGLSIYASKRAALPHTPPPNPLPDSQKKTTAAIALAGVAAVVGAAASGVLNTGNFPQVLLSCVLLAVVVCFVRLFTSPRIDAQHKRYVVAYIPMFIAVSLFVALFMQFYTVVTVYFEETVNRNFLGFTVPMPWKDSLESVWVILLSGVFAALWTKLGKRQPKTPLKFALSLMVTGVTFLCFVPFVASGKPMSMLVFALLLIIFEVGELLLSPIATSFATKIAPPVFKTQMVALNFLAFSIGFTLGGLLFKNFYDAKQAADFYQLLFYIGVVAGGLMLICAPALNKVLKDVD